MQMHSILPGSLYGAMGYRVFSFLFNWTDTRWEMDLRNRMFQFAPVYVSAESMRWWLGRECFAQQRCILATREEGQMEDAEDEEEDAFITKYYKDGRHTDSELPADKSESLPHRKSQESERGQYAWYDEQFPPLALWVCGADDLVDGRRLLRRFDRGREPHVNVVHKKIIEGYEHLDVIWAMDCIDKVGKEIKEVVWKTASEEARRACRTPKGCEDVERNTSVDRSCSSSSNTKVNGGDEKHSTDETHVQHSAKGADVDAGNGRVHAQDEPVSSTRIDTTAGDWRQSMEEDRKESQEHEEERRK